MEKGCQMIYSHHLTPQEIMDKDRFLLEHLESSLILHLYNWGTPCLTIGYFLQAEDHLHLKELQEEGIVIARRPTGGGISFHLTDFSFSVLIPLSDSRVSSVTKENYALVNTQVIQALLSYQKQIPSLTLSSLEHPAGPFCMARPTIFDIMMGGKKIGGAAQRRTKKGILHQGTLSLTPVPKKILQKVLKQPEEMLPAMQLQGGSLFTSMEEVDIEQVRMELSTVFTSTFHAFAQKKA